MASDKDWTLRYYREGDEQGILDLLTAAFGRWPSVDIEVEPLDHLRWKLCSDPLAVKSHYVAEMDGRIIGCQLIIVQRLKDRHRELLANTCTDYAVHPDYQGRGISRELFTFDRQRFAGTFDLLISITDNRIAKHQIKTIGWSKAIANTLGWIERSGLPDVGGAPLGALQIETTTGFDSSINAFCAEACQPFELCIVRDSAYLNWRYADPRAGRYTIRFAMEHDRPVGYSVLTISRGKGFAADMLVLPGRTDAVDALVHDALRHFAEQGVETVRSWMPARHPYRDVFLFHGFQAVRPVEYIGLGPHRDVELPPRDAPNAAVHFMPGDTDIV